MNIEHSDNFAKVNALGNQILVLDFCNQHKFAQNNPSLINHEKPFRSNFSKSNIFNSLLKHQITKFEQLMLLHNSCDRSADFNITIYNNDGSIAGACGNGMRAVAYYLFHKYQIKQFKALTCAGLLRGSYLDDQTITVNMGRPRFGYKDLCLSKPLASTKAVDFNCYNLPPAMLVSMGNPHAVFLLEQLPSLEEIAKIGAELEHNQLFAEGCNISFAKINNPELITLITWERGAGLTLACGSAACATMVAAREQSMVADKVLIALRGGELTLSYKPGQDILMTGGAKGEAFGQISELGEFKNLTLVT